MSEIIFWWYLQQQEEEEEEERRREQERREREEEEKRRKIAHRKKAPVIWNNEDWQRNRCIKAISMQPCVQNLISVIENVRPKTIETEIEKMDRRILEVGFEYEGVKNSLDTDIDKLKELGITISGRQNELSRLVPITSNVAKPEKTSETIGNTFTIKNGPPIELDSSIISNSRYFENRYKQMNQEGVEYQLDNLNSRLNRYHKFGKKLSFLLRTKKYRDLKDDISVLEDKKQVCELRKKEMESYQSLNRDQFVVIKSYFEHLKELTEISNRINLLFKEKGYLSKENNANIYDLTIKDVITNGEYNELVSEVQDLINRILGNDEETMKNVYELVKGEYPINIERRYLYDLIINNISELTKESEKEKKLS